MQKYFDYEKSKSTALIYTCMHVLSGQIKGIQSWIQQAVSWESDPAR